MFPSDTLILSPPELVRIRFDTKQHLYCGHVEIKGGTFLFPVALCLIYTDAHEEQQDAGTVPVVICGSRDTKSGCRVHE